jgi:cellulose synthase/poly-beta-1,6-N-acetylglucosamine synthase-like glycosyltransferase
VYRRRVLQEAGGFREDLPWAEDDELHHRLVQNGWELRLEPKARLYYRPRTSPGELTRQFYHYGRGRGQLCTESIYPTPRHRTIDLVLLIWTGFLFWNPVGWVLGGFYLGIVLTLGLMKSLQTGLVGIRLGVLLPLMHGGYWLGWLRERL